MLAVVLSTGGVMPAAAQTGTSDYDTDADGLIEVSRLTQLDAIRYDRNGDGTTDDPSGASSYATAFPNAVANMGCPTAGCIGYELTADLDFGNDADNWAPIGSENAPFAATFDGNGYTISNLYIDRPDTHRIGLFGIIGSDSITRQVGLLNVSVVGNGGVGALVGYNNGGTVSASYATGTVSGNSSSVGGLVGNNSGVVIASHATTTVVVTGENNWSTGGLVGWNQGTIMASHASGAVSGINEVGGLAGVNADLGVIANSYAIGAVAGNDYIGGLVGVQARNAALSNSYATGSALGAGYVGGLVGGNFSGSVVTGSYWDTQTSRRNTSAGGVGKTTAELQSPTNQNPGIYTTWDTAVWNFGEPNQYPALRSVGTGVPAPITGEDYDADDDALIEVSNLAQLNAIRYDLNGDGVAVGQGRDAYTRAFPGAVAGMGCPTAICTGYELIADLDFDTNGNGKADAGDAHWNGGRGWAPITAFTATFDGGELTISNMSAAWSGQTMAASSEAVA